MPRTWNRCIHICFLTAEEKQTLIVECLVHRRHSITIRFVVIIIKVVPQYGEAQTNHVNYTAIISQSFGHRITIFQEENVGTMFHLFQIISKRTLPPGRLTAFVCWVKEGPVHREKCTGILMDSIIQFSSSLLKLSLIHSLQATSGCALTLCPFPCSVLFTLVVLHLGSIIFFAIFVMFLLVSLSEGALTSFF